MSIIERNVDSYSFRKFNLKNIPEDLRSKEVCEFAIKKSDSNILYTPKEHISNEMLTEMMLSVKSNLKYLHLFPEPVWTIENLVKGVSSIYSKPHRTLVLVVGIVAQRQEQTSNLLLYL